MSDINEIPQYQSIKKVRGFKIDRIEEVDDGWILYGVDPKPISVKVNSFYFAKHVPRVGGYFVLYEDGYQSFSPAEAFEKGMVLM